MPQNEQLPESEAPAVLIVGAGAVGMTLGFYLALGGTQVTFLVRPGRSEAYDKPQRIYDYDTDSVADFTEFAATEDLDSLSAQSFRFIIVTLDGAASMSAEGTETLTKLSRLLRNTTTPVLMNGMGVGLRDFYLRILCIDDDRLLRGFIGSLAHQARAGILSTSQSSVSPDSADICIKHPSNRIGYRIAKSGPASADFIELYGRNGVSRCVGIDSRIVDIVGNSAFPLYAVSELAGWPSIEDLVSNHRQLWRLGVTAQREVLRTPENGWFGKLAALAMGPRSTSVIHLKMERATKPLDLQAFNRFHHGGKVRAQDVAILRQCLLEGQRQSHPMPALSDLVERLDSQG